MKLTSIYKQLNAKPKHTWKSYSIEFGLEINHDYVQIIHCKIQKENRKPLPLKLYP